jgi:L-asparaginase/Glu-tRNA(Gln) amidotransferase subunit D
MGAISAGYLNGQKARIKLLLAAGSALAKGGLNVRELFEGDEY